MVPLRGSPYRAGFSAKADPKANLLTGPAMTKHVASTLEEIHSFITECSKGAATKDKSVATNVKELISVKDYVE